MGKGNKRQGQTISSNKKNSRSHVIIQKKKPRQQQTSNTKLLSRSSYLLNSDTLDLLQITLNSSSRPLSAQFPYSPLHYYLLIGEADFSFARALARGLGESGRGHIIASTLENKHDSLCKYPTCQLNISDCESKGVKMIFEVDGTKLALDTRITGNNINNSNSIQSKSHNSKKFDRIIFNFPHVGGSLEKDIQLNQEILQKILGQCRSLLQMETGEIHITLRDTPFYQKWKLETLGDEEGLTFITKKPFDGKPFESLGYKPVRTDPAVREAPSWEGSYIYVFKVNPQWKKNKSMDIPNPNPNSNSQGKKIQDKKSMMVPESIQSKKEIRMTFLGNTSQNLHKRKDPQNKIMKKRFQKKKKKS